MSQQLATFTVKNNTNTHPPPFKKKKKKKKLLTWIKASKQDQTVADKTQAGKFKSR